MSKVMRDGVARAAICTPLLYKEGRIIKKYIWRGNGNWLIFVAHTHPIGIANMGKVDLDTLQIVNNEGEKRYEADLGDAIAKIEYIPTKTMIVFTHTEVPPAYEGQGIANKMIRHVLDEARANNMQVNPMCPFVKLFVARHPEYRDIVPERLRP